MSDKESTSPESGDDQQELALLRRKNTLQALEIEILRKECALITQKQEQDTLRLRQDNERLQKKLIEAQRELEALRQSARELNHWLAPLLSVDLNSGELSQRCKVLGLTLKWPKFAVRLLWPAKPRYL